MLNINILIKKFYLLNLTFFKDNNNLFASNLFWKIGLNSIFFAFLVFKLLPIKFFGFFFISCFLLSSKYCFSF